MRICIYEDSTVVSLWPLTQTRPAFDLRCGVFTLLERQRRYFGANEVGVWIRPELVELCRQAHPDLVVNDHDWFSRSQPTVLVNSRWVPPATSHQTDDVSGVGLVDKRVAYVAHPTRGVEELTAESLQAWVETCMETMPTHQVGGAVVQYPWDLVENNQTMLREDPPFWQQLHPQVASPTGVHLSGPTDRFLVAPDAKVETLVFVDTTEGPVLIDSGAEVHAFSRVQGPCYVGPGTRVLGAKVQGSSFGPGCRIGGEVEVSIVQGYSNKAHEGFLGHSYLGEWVNLGAGVQTSDLRNDYGPVRMPLNGHVVNTGLLKVGSFLGDHTKASIGTLFNTGSIVGVFGHLLTSGTLLPRMVPPFVSYAHGQLRERTDLRQMFTTASTVMARRGQQWTQVHADYFLSLFEQTSEDRRHRITDADQRRLRRVV